MTPLVAAVGVGVVVLVLVDVAWTAISVSSGSGPVASRLTRLAWGMTAPLRHRGRHRAATIAGVGTVLSVVGMWFLLLLTGWGVVFAAADGSVTNDLGQPTSTIERFVFAGYTVFTLGNGEFRPHGTIWQIATVAAALTGLTIVTLAVTYLILVVGAASERRQLAAAIAHLGDRPDLVLANAWTGQDFNGLPARLDQLTERLDQLTEQHLAFPVVHYFHSPQRRRSAPAMIAVLDDAVTLLLYGVSPTASPGARRLRGIRTSLDDFLETLHGPFIRPTSPPAPLALDQLADTGIPLVTPSELARRVEGLRDRRALLAALAADDGFPMEPLPG